MAEPFLKWAGGKGQLLGAINARFPEGNINTYIEPFVGSGAVLFDLLDAHPEIENIHINDINPDLINVYRVISENCEQLIDALATIRDEYIPLEHEPRTQLYNTLRDEYNTNLQNPQARESVRNAALFIFLNRTCFNGLYRVNRRGLFNVPHGRYANPNICNAENLRAVSTAIRNVHLHVGDFAELENVFGPNCFMYLDPPYKPITETASFTSYAAGEFDDNEQIRLREFCDRADQAGVQWMLSNSDPTQKNPNDRFFDEQYAAYNIERVQTIRHINANAAGRGAVSELLITNY